MFSHGKANTLRMKQYMRNGRNRRKFSENNSISTNIYINPCMMNILFYQGEIKSYILYLKKNSQVIQKSLKFILQQQYYVMGSNFHNLKICSVKLLSSNDFTSENKDYIQFNAHILNKFKY